MQLTPHQIRSAVRAHAVPVCAAGVADDELLGAMCRRLALVPDVRWSKVEEVRARLRASGAPSAQALADMLLDELGSVAAG